MIIFFPILGQPKPHTIIHSIIQLTDLDNKWEVQSTFYLGKRKSSRKLEERWREQASTGISKAVLLIFLKGYII